MNSSIHGALSIPTVTSYPSSKCLQITSDGQLCFVTKAAIYILTPDLGVNYDTSSTIKSTKQISNGAAQGWFRTIIPIGAITPYKWPECSQAWGAVSLGSLDLTMRDAVASPSNLSAEASCILAVLTSNMDLTLWTASQNSLKGEWIKLADLIPFLINTLALQDDSMQVLKAQITSICWTPQISFRAEPPIVIDGSFLALGSRAGMLNFFRYRLNDSMLHLGSVYIASRWVTQLSASSWIATDERTCTIQIAYALDDGAVGTIRVSQLLEDASPTTTFDMPYSLRFFADPNATSIHEPDKASVVTLQWIASKDGMPVLVFSKPGVLFLWAPVELSMGWSGLRALPISTQKMSSMSSSLSPATGIQYIPQQDAMVVTLFDGSMHMLQSVSSNPVWCAEQNIPTAGAISRGISQAARQMAAEVEGRELIQKDAHCILGFTGYDADSSFIWAHEIVHPADFSYKHDAKQRSTLITGKLWKESSDEWLLTYVASILTSINQPLAAAPIQLLRPVLFHISHPERLHRIKPRLFELLRPEGQDYTLDIQLPIVDGPVTPEIRAGFRRSLHRHLFGWNELLSLRLKLAIADCVWKLLSGNQADQILCGQIAQSVLNTIAHRVLRTLIRHLLAISNCLTEADVPFVLRIVVQSMLPGLPPDLTAEAEKLTDVVKQRALVVMGPNEEDVNKIAGNQLNEVCPACKVQVQLQDITRGSCPNGHNWARCSVTSFLLSTSRVRTCIACSRKAFLPLSSAVSTPSDSSGAAAIDATTAGSSIETTTTGVAVASGSGSGTGNWLPGLARGWVVEELLEAVHRCLFCGNMFVSGIL